MTIDPKTIEERIVKNESTLKKLDERYIKACCPDSYKGVKDYRDTRTEEYSRENIDRIRQATIRISLHTHRRQRILREPREQLTKGTVLKNS